MNKIYVTKNFCRCKYCKGSIQIKTELDKESFLASREDDWQTVLIGAQNPRLITFPANLLYVGNVSGSGQVVVFDSITNEKRHLGLVGKLVFSDSDKSHYSKERDCRNTEENRKFQLYKRPFFSCEEFEIIYTRSIKQDPYVAVIGIREVAPFALVSIK